MHNQPELTFDFCDVADQGDLASEVMRIVRARGTVTADDLAEWPVEWPRKRQGVIGGVLHALMQQKRIRVVGRERGRHHRRKINVYAEVV